MRGNTFTRDYIIVDEAQNVTHKQMEMIVTRLGRGSKMVICGDMRQKDLSYKLNSGLPFLLAVSQKISKIGEFELKNNHRNPLVEEILDYYNEFNNTLYSDKKANRNNEKFQRPSKARKLHIRSGGVDSSNDTSVHKWRS